MVRRCAIALIFIAITTAAWAQDAPPAREQGAASLDNKEGATNAEGQDGKCAKNFNIDALMLYGQYNRILWEGSITQSFDAFTYQLKSNFKRSNDFGYRNSRYYDNEIGFTGDADVTERWKLSPQVDVRNDSHGMFRNPYYSREEKDRVSVRLKNEVTPMPMRWTIAVGGVYAIHRLDSTIFGDTIGMVTYHSSEFYKFTFDLGWEYIMSAANKFTFNSRFNQYWFSSADNNTDTTSTFVWYFNISEYLKFGLGPLYEYNRDGGHFVSGLAEISTVNIKHISLNASYRYEMPPFTPEQFYFEQRYVQPTYRLGPGKGHRAELGVQVGADFKSDAPVYVERLNLRASGMYRTLDRYYSFFTLPYEVLYPHQMVVSQYRGRCQAGIGVRVIKAGFELGGEYEFNGWRASDYVTYLPHHQAGGYIRISISRVNAEFSTGYRGLVETSPFMHIAMGGAITGTVSLQARVMDSFSLFVRVDNIYNTRYDTVYGYPEQGRTLIGGLRVVI